MGTLYDLLKAYGESDAYPFHMPGHKRQIKDFGNPFEIDITEIHGFDNLHHAEGVLKEAQERLARLRNSEDAWFLVNGSSCGILSAVSACTRVGGKILAARNCHKAVYHAIYLRQLRPVYLWPMRETEYGLNGGIDPEDMRKILESDPEIQSVIVTSPTYDGVVSDIRALADIAHAHGIPLIVDEAHGAHFGFHEYFPVSAVSLGADIVIQSFHKTLPSLTQTAVMFRNGKLTDRERLARFLGIYQSSSPSYVFMASLDRCTALLEEKGDTLFEEFAGRLEAFRKKAEQWNSIQVPGKELIGRNGVFDLDRSKLVLSVKGVCSGEELSSRLREEYHLEMEMDAAGYALALTSFLDTEEGFERLAEALTQIDKELHEMQAEQMQKEVHNENLDEWTKKAGKIPAAAEKPLENKENGQIPDYVFENEYVCSPADAWDALSERISLKDSLGRISGEFMYLYPPGIPLLVPGERISQELLARVQGCLESGLSIQGMEDFSCQTVRVLK